MPTPSSACGGASIEGVSSRPRLELSFDICVRHHQLASAVELARRCQVRFVLDHIGKPAIRAGLPDPWRNNMKELGRLPNVHYKLSGVITEARPSELDL
jgi:L-fuconolactonase